MANQHWRFLVPILLIYFLLAFYRIDHQSLWEDEVVSLKYAAPSGPLFNGSIWFRGQGPLYFVLLHLWAKMGTSESILRSLATVLGAIGLIVFYFLGLRLFSQRIAKVGTILFMASPFLIWYSQEVRYITLMITTSLLAMYTFHRAVSSDRSAWWILYGISSILSFAAFVSTILLPAAQGIYLLGSISQRRFLKKWLVCQALSFILFVWWANDCHFRMLGGHWKDLYVEFTNKGEKNPESNRSPGLSTGGSRQFTPAVLPYTFFAFSSGFSLGPTVQELHWSRSMATLAPHVPLLAGLFLLFGSLFVLGLANIWKQQDLGLFLTLWLVIPTMGVLGISALTDMSYNVRYASMSLPAFFLILTAGVFSIRKSVIQTAFLLAILSVNSVALINYYFNPRYEREDARSAAKYLESAVRQGDVILVLGSTTALRYYYQGSSQIIRWTPTAVERLQTIDEDSGRLWLVEVRAWQGDPKRRLKTVLERGNPPFHREHFSGVDVYCYSPRDLKVALLIESGTSSELAKGL